MNERSLIKDELSETNIKLNQLQDILFVRDMEILSLIEINAKLTKAISYIFASGQPLLTAQGIAKLKEAIYSATKGK